MQSDSLSNCLTTYTGLRRHLRDARGPETLDTIRRQVESLRDRWSMWYGGEGEKVAPSFLAVRRAKLARVLRFYADKARRHANDATGEGLSAEAHSSLIAEIDKMVEKGAEYAFAAGDSVDRGWMFCPDFLEDRPREISPPNGPTRIFLFGPRQLPDGPAPAPRPEVAERNPPTATKRAPGLDAAPAAGANRADDAPAAATTAEAPQPVSADDDDPPEILLGTDAFTQSEVVWPLTLKGNPHLLVAGLPGMGKTTCLLNLCGQMIAGGVSPIIFSFHEDIDDRLDGNHAGVRFLDFQGLGFNPLEVIDRDSRMGYLDVAGAIRDIFMAIYPDLGDLQGASIRTAIKRSFDDLGWDSPDADLRTIREPAFGRFVEILKSTPKPDAGLRALLARLGELAEYGFFDAAEAPESLWDAREPIVVRIHKTRNDVLQKAFAAIVFYKLYKDMFRRGIQERITHALVFDEAHRAAKLALIPTMAKECRKYGISLVIASQEARDFHPSLFSAIANYLILRVTETDAKALVRNVATSEQERTLIDKIKQMDKYKALYLSERSKRPSFVSLHS